MREGVEQIYLSDINKCLARCIGSYSIYLDSDCDDMDINWQILTKDIDRLLQILMDYEPSMVDVIYKSLQERLK